VNGLGTHELPEAVHEKKNEAAFGDAVVSMLPERSASSAQSCQVFPLPSRDFSCSSATAD
jgi:hypothetical protein